jgi:putative flippase GtrA
MSADTVTEMPVEEMSTAIVELPFHHRVRVGISSGENWLQLIRFGCVGATGFVMNTVAFWFCLHAIGLDYKVALPLAYLAGTTNNFIWNRRWTFGHKREEHPAKQGVKFYLVSTVAFLVYYWLVVAFVHWTTIPKVPIDMAVNVLVTPINFLGQKLWSFKN